MEKGGVVFFFPGYLVMRLLREDSIGSPTSKLKAILVGAWKVILPRLLWEENMEGKEALISYVYRPEP